MCVCVCVCVYKICEIINYALQDLDTRDQTAKIHWIIETARELQKNIYFCFIEYAKVFDCVDHNKLENS